MVRHVSRDTLPKLVFAPFYPHLLPLGSTGRINLLKWMAPPDHKLWLSRRSLASRGPDPPPSTELRIPKPMWTWQDPSDTGAAPRTTVLAFDRVESSKGPNGGVDLFQVHHQRRRVKLNAGLIVTQGSHRSPGISPRSVETNSCVAQPSSASIRATTR